MMNLSELKQAIEQRAGISARLLTGETAEELVAQAKALLAFKRDCAPPQQKATREQFAAWFNAGETLNDAAGVALDEIEDAVRAEAGFYPEVTDAGETESGPDARPAREQFAEWFNRQFSL